jgi:hypothetical protein
MTTIDPDALTALRECRSSLLAARLNAIGYALADGGWVERSTGLDVSSFLLTVVKTVAGPIRLVLPLHHLA